MPMEHVQIAAGAWSWPLTSI